MINKDRFLLRCFFFLALLATAAASTPLWAQFEEEEEEGAPVQETFEIDEENFDQWIFSNMQNARMARQWLDSMVALKIESMDAICSLTEDQKAKIRLAGKGDIQRFSNHVEEVRKKFLAVRMDQNRINDIWQEIQPLQNELQSGIFGETSLIHKILMRTLNPEQQTRYAESERERRRFYYEAKIGLVVAMLEQGMPLQENQRHQFVTLLTEETEPPLKFGEYDHYVVLVNAARLPEEKLKPIFDHSQWQALQQQLDQAKAMEHHLRENGLIQ